MSFAIFLATNAANGQELWITDGTSSGTLLLKDIWPGATGSSVSILGKLDNGNYLLAATDGTNGRELWICDGTSNGTRLLRDIYSGTNPSNPAGVVLLGNGKALFQADNGVGGIETWVTDGTSEGTQLLKDVYPGLDSSSPGVAVSLGNGTALFRANDGTHGSEIWITDGTTAGTTLLKDICAGVASSYVEEIVSLGDGRALFRATNGTSGDELWITNGTGAGTVLVKDIWPGTISSIPQNIFSLGNGKAVFSANDGSNGQDLWVTNGTSAGTVLLKNIGAYSASSDPTGFVAIGAGKAIFKADDGAAGQELWITDGTSAGTQMLKDIYPGNTWSYAYEFVPIGNGKVVFRASDDTHGQEIWVTDGTSGGTTLVKDIWSGTIGSVGTLVSLGNGKVLFRGNDGVNGTELWVTDGTSGGTVLVKNIAVSGSSNPSDIVSIGDGLAMFRATSSGVGEELWITDGTSSGTMLVKDIVAGSGSSTPTGISPIVPNIWPTGTAGDLDGTEDVPLTFGAAELIVGFSDPDGGALALEGLSLAAGDGALVDNGDGTWTYTAPENANGIVGQLAYQLVDERGGTVEVSRDVYFSPVNDAVPVLTGTPATLVDGTEDQAYLIDVADMLVGYTDADGDTLSISGLTADHGTITDNGDDTFTLTPAANYNGLVTLNYNVIDGNGGSTTSSNSLNLSAVNDAPALTGTAATLTDCTEDTAYLIDAADLLAGYTDVEGHLLAVDSLTTDHGTITDNGDDTFTLTPDANYNGTVTISYNVIDGNGGSTAASNSLNISAVNDAPALTGTAATLADGAEDTSYLIAAADLLAGYTDTEGHPLAVSALTADHGTITDNGDETFTLTPAANYNGLVTLNYNVIDGNGGSTTASNSLNLSAVNDAPALTGTAATFTDGTEDTSYLIDAADLLAGYTDVEGHLLAVDSLTADHGTITDNGDDTFTLTPAANYNGTVTLNYNVVDGNGGSTATSNSLTLAAVNDAPALTGTAATLADGTEDTSYLIAAADLLAGYTDTEGHPLAVSALTADHGTITDNGDDTFTLTPAANYNGTVTLSYNVVDGNGGSTAASNSLNLSAVNDAPALTGTAATLADGTEDTAYLIDAADLLSGYTDVEGHLLAVDSLTADHGTITDNGDDTFTLNPDANYNGTVTLSYNVIDGNGGSTAAVTTLNLSSAAEVGTIGDDYINCPAGGDTAMGLAGNDTLTGASDGRDSLVGDAGNDSLDGRAGNDTLNGGDDNDYLQGSQGNDWEWGGFGNDTLMGDEGRDMLSGNAGDDEFDGGAGNDSLWGGEGNDVMRGGNDSDSVGGGIGDDWLLGGTGADTLWGGQGNDTVAGGWGDDSLTGDSGFDGFYFQSPMSNAGVDTIADFVSGEDRLVIARLVTNLANTGALWEERFASGSTASEADDRFIFDGTTGKLYYDADGNGAGAQVQFALLQGVTSLSASDFQIV